MNSFETSSFRDFCEETDRLIDMNIKGLVGNVMSFPVRKNEEAKAKTALDTDNEKDANGQSSNGGDQRRRNLTPAEVMEAVQHLQNLQGIKDNGLKVRQETSDGITVVYVEDRNGKIVRRIPESELSLLMGGDRERKSGRLLNKAL